MDPELFEQNEPPKYDQDDTEDIFNTGESPIPEETDFSVKTSLSDEIIDRLELRDRLNQMGTFKTITDIFENDPHLTVEHLKAVKRLMKKSSKTDVLSRRELRDSFKMGIFFIEAMYEYIFKNSRDIERRPGQVLGSKLMFISHFIKGQFMGEYPTGSGKSFMYLIYACAVYHTRKHKVTIATAGINLQEQLDSKDLPYISGVYQSVTGKIFPYTLIKGRQNYACNKKLEAALRFKNSGIYPVGINDTRAYDNYLNKIPQTGFNGDLSLIDGNMTYEIREVLTVKSAKEGGCRSCEFYKECFFYERSKRAQNAAVVVINYHVFYMEFDTIKRPGFLSGGIPDAYVFDEAHEFPIIGRDFSEESFALSNIQWIKPRMFKIEEMAHDSHRKAFKAISFATIGNFKLFHLIDELEKAFTEDSVEWLKYVRTNSKFFENDIIVDSNTSIPTKNVGRKLKSLIENLEFALEYIVVEILHFNSLSNFKGFVLDEESAEYETELIALEAIEDLIEVLYGYLSVLSRFNKPENRGASFVYWISKTDANALTLKLKNTEVTTLMSIMGDRMNIPTVSVSATLSVNESFSFYRRQMNIDPAACSYEIIGISPFDLKKQELWYLPKDSASGSSAGIDYDAMVSRNIIELLSISRGGALVLFTSKKSMDYAYDQTTPAISGIQIYKQGESSKRLLLERFTQEINSVLFANKSFFTGIDVKGPSLRLIILDKLPFENPSDPVARTLGNKPGGFANYVIPTMVTTLKQIIGRGIRSKDDKCVIAFMDDRLKYAGYASLIRKSFYMGGNTSKRTENIEDVAMFMDSIFEEYGRDIFEAQSNSSYGEFWDDGKDEEYKTFKGIDFKALKDNSK